MPDRAPMHVECINPILRVEDMARSVRFYVEVLGFTQAPWGNDTYSCVGRDGQIIYLCRGGQGHTGAWVWIGIEDVRALHAALKARGVAIRQEPKNEPWALEMQLEDPDGNVLRFGSEPEPEA